MLLSLGASLSKQFKYIPKKKKKKHTNPFEKRVWNADIQYKFQFPEHLTAHAINGLLNFII